ncbi:hypothetical protein AR438_00240 [Chryseobacterium aquaticum]|uniref:Glucosyltransferase 3-like C-terminal domain-containing protein n=1 Tax=Chryseobacterium aquaticum TaxID=452084 RepID=A0A0Q3KCJ5_9FLAO|nr:hypothetical protein [Chryseobacterium aquaticum]KQK27515.1 hypothetical protein AR438_00240 [Chryseobacterium aquaticum]
MNSLYLISNTKKTIREGGMARNKAFEDELRRRNAKIFTYTSMNFYYRVFIFIKTLFFLFFVKKSTVVILQNTFITYIFPLPFFKYNLMIKFIEKILKSTLRKNIVYFEVNDLIYEQSIDLKLEINPNSLIYEDFIFKLPNIKFIFASHKMRDYVVEKYNIEFKNTQVILNGAPEILTIDELKKENSLQNAKPIKFIYVGTLNKGREIEKLINIFENQHHELYLMGESGEWINLYEKKNVVYLGSFGEHEALLKTSQFDIGVIPYNLAFYYNLCYPTKNSFYLSAGLPILSTPLEETKNVINSLSDSIAIFAEIKEWKSLIMDLDKSKIISMKKNVNQIKQKVYWSTILSHLKIEVFS